MPAQNIPNRLMSCGVLITQGQPIEKFLLMKHKSRWDLPKGHTEPGETELECALRELAEETGILADQVELDPEFRFATDYVVRYKRFGRQPIPKTTVIFLGRLLCDVKIVVTEHLGYQWMPWCPPHSIQEWTLDPLLMAVERHLGETDCQGQSV